ncbi:PadR family transcriptional regulator [Candidatus Enterococcus palustris]|nr:PadR family transcriptional regulator [Enterococcus sp. 7F3_DIV0205]
MDELVEDKLKRIYIPMTETGFYILFALREERHGYNIIQYVRELTDQEIIVSAGTMYGSLSKMEKDGLIRVTKEENRRKSYLITELGEEILLHEINRIKRLYKNSIGEKKNGV